ncbi:MAG: hypothetical protein HQL95_00805 [Magnetococcales bacterium]|nr:hypothetical protein [Magnetococcales bacterium]
MDVVAILNMLNQSGGPTVMFLIMAGLMWMQHITIMDLRHDLEAITKEFNEFQITNANEKVRKADVDEIKEMIKESHDTTKALIARMFERLDDHAGRCGKDCLASMQARADFRVASRPLHLSKGEAEEAE